MNSEDSIQPPPLLVRQTQVCIPDQKNIIDVTHYENGFTTYTAKWCNPCCKIKPFVLEKLRGVNITSEYPIEKHIFKETINNFIPFFVVGDKSIQTSEQEVLKKFMVDNKVIKPLVLDSDF